MTAHVAPETMETAQIVRCRQLMMVLTLNQPLLGLASVRTQLKPGLGFIDTAGINVNGTIYIGESFFKGLTDEEARFVLAHELLHLLLYHFNRRGDRQPLRWNKAADRWINHFLKEHCCKDATMTALSYGLFLLDPAHEGLTVEELYDLEPEDDGKGNGKGPDGKALPTAGCGPEGNPSPDPNDSTDETDGALAAATWRRIAETAKAMAREAGSAAGDALASMLSPPPPRIRWSSIIQRACQDAEAQAGDDDVSWSRRNRRHVDVYIPGAVTTTINVAVIIDVSGSVPDDSVNQAIAETWSITKEAGVSCYLIIHDAIVQWEGWLSGSLEQIQAAVKGRGGTMFAPAYTALGAVKKRFGVMVHLTDACPCDAWPDKPDNCARGVVALIGYASPEAPSWAQVIPVELPLSDA